MNYILITPVKNEEKNLSKLAECIINQTRLPIVWVIVDGNSTDHTPEIIKELCEEFEWIYGKTQKNLTYKGHFGFAWAVKEGYEYADNMCTKRGMEYMYVGKVDADVLLPMNYFEKLIEKFEKDPKIGIASGIGYTIKPNCQKRLYEEINEEDVERNDLLPDTLPDKRLYRKASIDMAGGFLITNAPDTVMLVKARLKGWKTEWYNDIKFYDTRKGMSTSRGVWEGSKMEGYVKYYLDYNPILFFYSVLYKLSKKPYYPVFGILYGYCSSMLRRKKKIGDKEVRDYFRYRRLKEIMEMAKNKLNRWQ